MLPDDIFRSQLQTTITTLQYWAPSIADAARIEEAETGRYWRMAVAPRVTQACTFVLVLHFDQCYDVTLAGEAYERLPLQSFALFLPFAEAVADGNVVQRRWISRFTGLERCVETIVTLASGHVWREARGHSNATPSLEDDGTELRERRFVPYRR